MSTSRYIYIFLQIFSHHTYFNYWGGSEQYSHFSKRGRKMNLTIYTDNNSVIKKWRSPSSLTSKPGTNEKEKELIYQSINYTVIQYGSK